MDERVWKVIEQISDGTRLKLFRTSPRAHAGLANLEILELESLTENAATLHASPAAVSSGV